MFSNAVLSKSLNKMLIKTEGAIAGYRNVLPFSENMKLFKIRKKKVFQTVFIIL